MIVDEVGALEIVKEKVRYILSQVTTDLQPMDSHIFAKWRLSIDEVQSFPIITLRLGLVTHNDLIYGRTTLPNDSHGDKGDHHTGTHASIAFIAHLWHELQFTDPNSPPDEKVLELADLVHDYLEKYIGDADSGILYFDKINCRPMPPVSGPLLMVRVEITGTIIINQFWE